MYASTYPETGQRSTETMKRGNPYPGEDCPRDTAASKEGISVVLATYAGDDPEALAAALDSIFSQTRRPDEVILVVDGEIGRLSRDVIDGFLEREEILRKEELDENRGKGPARNRGVRTASHPLVAIMDSDDICTPSRFEKQIGYLRENPEIDVLGGYIAEFGDNPADVRTIRKVPLSDGSIKRLAKFRSPMNHVTTMFRRSLFLECGGYRGFDPGQDYELFVRMIENDAVFANIPEVLVKVRAGSSFAARRGGWAYLREEIKLQREFVEIGFISTPTAILNIALRIPVRMVPAALRWRIYDRVLRTPARE